MRNLRVGLWTSLFLLAAACTYTTKVADGPTAIDRKQYSVAVPLLQKEYKQAKLRSEKGKIAAHLARAYEAIGQDEEAVLWYQNAYNNAAGTAALRGKAAALKRLERYEEAIETYTDLGLELGSKYEFRNQIQGAEIAQAWLAEDEKAYAVFPVDFNSAQADFGPMPYGVDRLVFTSDRKSATGEELFAWTGRGFTDLFVLDIRSGQVSALAANLNTEAHEGNASFNQAGDEIFFNRCVGTKREDAYCAIYYARKQGDGWGPAEKLAFQAERINYLHPSLSEDGKTLFFSANKPDGWGGYDIYSSVRDAAGNWSEPELLNRSINTQGNEQFPFSYKDTLYFASDGHIGMGGLDIFKTYTLPNGRYAPVMNLKPPLNSGADDFGYMVLPTEAQEGETIAIGYFSSNRPGGKGTDDIYRYEQRPLPPAAPVAENEEIVYSNVLDVYVVEKIYAEEGNPTSAMLGRRPIPNAKVTISLGNNDRAVSANEEGLLSLVLNKDADYRFLAAMEGYLSQSARFSSKGLPEDPGNPRQRYDLEIELAKIYRNQEIVLENIYYDFDQSFIREDARPSLDQLADLLLLNQAIKIELGSHTDCRGRAVYNQSLSQRRAQAAVDYLIEKGVRAERLLAKGYGAAVPAVDCLCARCTEEQHQRNRRTTFRILD